MGKVNNNNWLKRYMKANGCTRPEIANRVKVGISTVDRWLAPPKGVSRRSMPDMAVELLKTQDQVEELKKT